ncbi:MAG: cupin domain-containing protein [Acidimicrobiales bacterium]|nr:cupin domain-containing protein [Acidimicrobiales bacterium]
MSGGELGGDPPCWAHLLDDDAGEDALVVDLGAEPSRSGGAVWSLPHGGDLDANLVRLDAGEEIGAHVNREVDVLIVVRGGDGELVVDGRRRRLGPDHLALVPKGSMRSIVAEDTGIVYLSVHRRRGPLGITPRPEKEDPDEP